MVPVTEVFVQTLQLQRLPLKPGSRATSKRTGPQWQPPVWVGEVFVAALGFSRVMDIGDLLVSAWKSRLDELDDSLMSVLIRRGCGSLPRCDAWGVGLTGIRCR